MKIPSGTIKRIHVSQVNLRENRKDSGSRPLFTIQTSSGPIYASHVDVKGPSQLMGPPNKPLKCGARIWIETKAEVEYL
jgi:hypothetical protein